MLVINAFYLVRLLSPVLTLALVENVHRSQRTAHGYQQSFQIPDFEKLIGISSALALSVEASLHRLFEYAISSIKSQ